ncbi:hypothetical protein T484DRAFT_1819948 [Baffinella frigidus]|nr:hypothetical protein T484DRAFT_1819948 [Cryptophyta sp. CCMP2293]
MVVKFADQLLGYVARAGLAIQTPDASLDPCYNHTPDASLDPRYNHVVLNAQLGFQVTSLICIPVPAATDADTLVGIMFVSNKESGSAFSDEDNAIATAKEFNMV